MKLALKLTPQRSTQYTNMVQVLATPELWASPLRTMLNAVEPVTLGGQSYLLATFDDVTELPPDVPGILGRLGAISEVYEYFERIDTLPGPFLRPVDLGWRPFVPLEMAEARRYKGKTNEIFTRVLLNIAIFAGAYGGEFGGRLRVLDPLAGGATTLFLALAHGYDAFGIEQGRQDVETGAVFVKQYLHSEGIPFKERDERGRRAGRRYQFEVGHKGETRWLVLVHGDSSEASLHLREVVGGPRMHAVVGDLPYGIQHFGEVAALLHKSLPEWEKLLLPGGTLALAWNATHIERAPLVELVERQTGLRVRQDGPYAQLAHTVDRVIKRRDILVGIKEG